jgi:hypothetical protein
MRLILFAAVSLCLLADTGITSQDREPVLKLKIAIQTKNTEMGQLTIQIQQAQLQYVQAMDQKKQEAAKLQEDYDAAVASLKSKCAASSLLLDDKTLDCVSPAKESKK